MLPVYLKLSLMGFKNFNITPLKIWRAMNATVTFAIFNPLLLLCSFTFSNVNPLYRFFRRAWPDFWLCKRSILCLWWRHNTPLTSFAETSHQAKLMILSYIWALVKQESCKFRSTSDSASSWSMYNPLKLELLWKVLPLQTFSPSHWKPDRLKCSLVISLQILWRQFNIQWGLE